MTPDEWITAAEAERLLLEWQLSVHSGPFTSSITGSWTRWDHWKRARAFESTPDSRAAPLRIASLDLPVPFAPELEHAFRPTKDKIIERITEWMG